MSLTWTAFSRRFKKSDTSSAPDASISRLVAVWTGAAISSTGTSLPCSGVLPTTVTVKTSGAGVWGAGAGGESGAPAVSGVDCCAEAIPGRTQVKSSRQHLRNDRTATDTPPGAVRFVRKSRHSQADRASAGATDE